MLIDCDRCAMRELACEDCVVSVLLGGPPGVREVDDDEERALAVLAEGGLVPHLRLVPLGLPVVPAAMALSLPAAAGSPRAAGPPGAAGSPGAGDGAGGPRPATHAGPGPDAAAS